MEFVKKTKDFVKYIAKVQMFDYSAQVTFYLILALFPALYVIIRTTALFSVSNEAINELLFYIFPGEGYNIVLVELESLSAETWQTILSGAIGIWSASMVISSIKEAVRQGKIAEDRRNFVTDRIMSIFITVVLGIGILLSLLIILTLNVFTGFVWEYMGITVYPQSLTMIPAGVIFLIDLVLVYMMVPVGKIKMTDALPGAVIAEILFIFGFWAFSYYVGSIANYSIVYGALSSVVVLLMWLYICSCILVFGGHVNEYIRSAKEERIAEKQQILNKDN